MLKRKLCEITFTWELTCDGPLLIADGRYSQKEDMPKNDKGKWPDKVFINRTPKNRMIAQLKSQSADKLQLDYYVPGTSLRGPFRAQAERIIRTLLPAAPLPLTACDPFDTTHSCSRRLVASQPAGLPYAAVCPACKLFGCTGTASRIRFEDAEVRDKDNSNKPVCSTYRDMIGIDRFTGGVFTGGTEGGGANMRFHVLENTRFTTIIAVTNFELWQLGLLAYVLRDFADGLVPIGFGKTKGFGLVKGRVTSITLHYPKSTATDQTLQHLGSLATPDECKMYKLDTAPDCTFPMSDLIPLETPGLNLYATYSVSDDRQNSFWEATAEAFNGYLQRSGQAA